MPTLEAKQQHMACPPLQALSVIWTRATPDRISRSPPPSRRPIGVSYSPPPGPPQQQHHQQQLQQPSYALNPHLRRRPDSRSRSRSPLYRRDQYLGGSSPPGGPGSAYLAGRVGGPAASSGPGGLLNIPQWLIQCRLPPTVRWVGHTLNTAQHSESMCHWARRCFIVSHSIFYSRMPKSKHTIALKSGFGPSTLWTAVG